MRKILSKKDLVTPSSVKFLYNSKFGNLVLFFLTRRWISKVVGKYLDSKLSRRRIKKYIKKNNIDMSLYKEKKYISFNDFFTREIKPENRPFVQDKNSFPSPCDGKLTAYRIDENEIFNIKGFDYTLENLLKNKELASKYKGRLCLVIRLSVEEYHRYFYIDNCTKE